MSKKKSHERYDPLWAKAKKVCRLNQEDIRRAKEMHMSPRSLMKNIPNTSEKWKALVKDWIRALHEKRFGTQRSDARSKRPEARGRKAETAGVTAGGQSERSPASSDFWEKAYDEMMYEGPALYKDASQNREIEPPLFAADEETDIWFDVKDEFQLMEKAERDGGSEVERKYPDDLPF